MLNDGSLAGWAVVHERFRGERTRYVRLDGATHPAARGRGIGTRLLGWAIARGEEALSAQPADLPRFLEAFRDVDWRATQSSSIVRAGSPRSGITWTCAEISCASIPPEIPVAGIRIVGYDDARSEAVRAAHNDSFADHWGSEAVDADDWDRDYVGDPHFRADLSFVALAGSEVAGYSVNYCSEADWAASSVRDAWIGQLGVRREWRGRGVATALLLRSMSAFRAAGIDAASLGVDSQNPTGAVGLYERVGFTVNRRFVRLRRPMAT